ncbi:MAG: SURF1 family protein [Gammaproteobacteria bacterium]|nr:SURF1 family protein [Gammaproteobacteria bacterium]
MKITQRYDFRPRFWPSLATLVLLPLLLYLGFWQLDRAAEKAVMEADFTAMYNRPAVALTELDDRRDAEKLYWRAVTISGRYTDNSYLLDNQINRGKPGYRLYTPLELNGSGDAVLVERDWLAMGSNRNRVPEASTPAGRVNLHGRIVPAPTTGILLAEHHIERLDDNRYRLQRIKYEELAAHGGLELLPYIVQLDEARDAGDEQTAVPRGFGPDRHRGYAFQWFALAATLLIIYVCVNIKRREER